MKKIRQCPVCMWEVKIGEHNEVGDFVLCKGCGAEYELCSIHPTRLRPLNFYNGSDEYQDSENTGESVLDGQYVEF